MKPLTPIMVDVIQKLGGRDASQMTAADVAHACGFRRGQNAPCSHNGKSMSPAQRVIFPLIGLVARGLVARVERRDGRSGGAFALTDSGKRYVIMLNSPVSK